MILTLLSFLSFLLISTHALRPPTPIQDSSVLCLDKRYATHGPSLMDCAAIIEYQLFEPQQPPRYRTFSRHPKRNQIPLPHTWETPAGK
ncbi:MAG: hypothetical protein Q9213_003541, partial [Squamulea squamosa]